MLNSYQNRFRLQFLLVNQGISTFCGIKTRSLSVANTSNDELETVRTVAKNFIDKEVDPFILSWEENPPFPAHKLFKKAGDLGLLGLDKPVKFGGKCFC